jgi:predicted RNase H-like HicB family nuclease
VVNFLWSTQHRKYFFCWIRRESSPRCDFTPPSYFVSLVSRRALRRISLLLFSLFTFHFLLSENYTAVRHRFERTIAGRSIVIEVTWVAENRWRAHIVRIPGVPTAMMPFYGETPDQAATNLSDWLDRAHQHQANTV